MLNTKLVSLRNKLRSIRLVWVTAVALQLLLNDKCRFTQPIVPAFITVLYKFELRTLLASPN